MNIIQKMLKDYYEIIEYDIKPGPVVMENIEKVINYGEPSYGGAIYAALIAEILRSFLSVVAPSFVPLAGQSIPTTGLPLCLLN